MLAVAAHRLNENLEEVLLANGGGLDQWRVMTILVERDECTMGTLAAQAMLLGPKASKLVDRMAANGLIFRRHDAMDRRRVLVRASPHGIELLSSWNVAVASLLDQYARALGTEADAFEATLRRLCQEFDAASEH